MQSPPTGQTITPATEVVEPTTKSTPDAPAAAPFPTTAPVAAPPPPDGAGPLPTGDTAPSDTAGPLSTGGAAPSDAGSGVAGLVTEGWSEVDQFLHVLIGEVATNARGYTSSVESAVAELAGKVDSLLADKGTNATAPTDPAIEDRLSKVENIAGHFVSAVKAIADLIGITSL